MLGTPIGDHMCHIHTAIALRSPRKRNISITLVRSSPSGSQTYRWHNCWAILVTNSLNMLTQVLSLRTPPLSSFESPCYSLPIYTITTLYSSGTWLFVFINIVSSRQIVTSESWNNWKGIWNLLLNFLPAEDSVWYMSQALFHKSSTHGNHLRLRFRTIFWNIFDTLNYVTYKINILMNHMKFMHLCLVNGQ